jgi:hypothetical protein
MLGKREIGTRERQVQFASRRNIAMLYFARHAVEFVGAD